MASIEIERSQIWGTALKKIKHETRSKHFEDLACAVKALDILLQENSIESLKKKVNADPNNIVFRSLRNLKFVLSNILGLGFNAQNNNLKPLLKDLRLLLAKRPDFLNQEKRTVDLIRINHLIACL